MQRPPIATDFARPSALPTANIRSNQQRSAAAADVNSEEYLSRLEEEWNLKIDEQVLILVNNMVDLVDLAKVRNENLAVSPEPERKNAHPDGFPLHPRSAIKTNFAFHKKRSRPS